MSARAKFTETGRLAAWDRLRRQPLERLNRARWARALRDGMVWLLPYFMLWSAALLAGELLRIRESTQALAALLQAMATILRDLMPLVIWGTMGAMAALQHGLPRTPVAFVCVACGAMSQFALQREFGTSVMAWHVTVAMLAPFALVWLIEWFEQQHWARLAPQSSMAGRNVVDSLNLVLPSLVAIVVCTVAALAAAHGIHWVLQRLPELPIPVHSPEWSAMLYVWGNSVLWFFGIHGYYALLPLLDNLPTVSSTPSQLLSQTFLGTFVFIGGSGSTFSLIVALLWRSRYRPYRIVAFGSLVPALINVNELLLFGLPVILNPTLLLPFVLAPTANLILALLATDAGWVSLAVTNVPFNSPVPFNAMLATGGDWHAIALQLTNVTVGALIYAPFISRRETRAHGLADTRQHAGAPALQALDTDYVQRREEANHAMDDPVRRLNERDSEALFKRRWADRGITDFDFELFFQPKVDPSRGQVTGCEALLRLHDGQGKQVEPGRFLPELERAGLLKDVDLWVMHAAVRQIAQWQEAGITVLPIAVNVSADSLMDLRAVARLADEARKASGLICVELTEGALLSDQQVVVQALDSLRGAGCRVDIDDFGTGYSALSYLHRFQVDGIKIDRSFTTALQHERGRVVFAELCAMAARLHLYLTIEGLEEAWQLSHLPRDVPLAVQGFYYAPPLRAQQYLAFIQQPIKDPLAWTSHPSLPRGAPGVTSPSQETGE